MLMMEGKMIYPCIIGSKTSSRHTSISSPLDDARSTRRFIFLFSTLSDPVLDSYLPSLINLQIAVTGIQNVIRIVVNMIKVMNSNIVRIAFVSGKPDFKSFHLFFTFCRIPVGSYSSVKIKN